MWAFMPSSTLVSRERFFTIEEVRTLAQRLAADRPESKDAPPVLRGRVWAGEDQSHGWAIECDSFEGFRSAVAPLSAKIEFLAYDEMALDDDALRIVQDDLFRFARDEALSPDVVTKAMSAMRSHENELFAVVAYAFLSSGRVIFIRVQNELARFVYQPDRLLSNEGLSSVRKLKTLVEN